MEAESRKRLPRRSSSSVSGMPRRVRREISRERRQSEQAPENMPTWNRGVAPSFLFVYPAFGAAPAPYMPASTTVRGPEDMLSAPLGQHNLSYEPPCGFVTPSFAMYDGSSDSYDHMLHFNQVMILNAGDDRLLCKVFPASLKGPTLAWFHKRETSSLCKPSSSRRKSPSAISPEDLEGPFNRLIRTVWMRSSIISGGALGQPHHSFTRYPWISLRQWKNCTDGRINIQHWRIISGQPPRP